MVGVSLIVSSIEIMPPYLQLSRNIRNYFPILHKYSSQTNPRSIIINDEISLVGQQFKNKSTCKSLFNS